MTCAIPLVSGALVLQWGNSVCIFLINHCLAPTFPIVSPLLLVFQQILYFLPRIAQHQGFGPDHAVPVALCRGSGQLWTRICVLIPHDARSRCPRWLAVGKHSDVQLVTILARRPIGACLDANGLGADFSACEPGAVAAQLDATPAAPSRLVAEEEFRVAA